jgi:glycoprotein-N-acetylgalactosamine 3-beta-galactosyltransferase
MWQKIRSMWAYAYHYYLNDYDYFHIAGDDVYLIPDNLRAYLMSPSVQRYIKDGYIDIFAKKHLRMASLWVTSNSDAATKERPLLIGMPMFHRGRTFPAGGAGYTLNRAALKVFGERGLDSYGANATDSREDVFMGRFFWEQGIYTIDTRDETGAWRYLGHLEKMYHFDGHRSVVQPKRLAAKFPGYHYPPGMEGISAQVVSVHLKDGAKSIPDLMRRYHDVLYRDDSCPDYFNNKH